MTGSTPGSGDTGRDTLADGDPVPESSFAPVAGVTLLVQAALAWALVELIGPEVLSGFVGATVGGLVIAWWRNGRSVRTDPRLRAVRTALRDHADPGPGLRDAVTDRARVTLGSPRSDTWVPPVLVGAPALACVVVAIVRGNVLTALPALPLAGFACGFLALRHARLVRASRWLTDSPYEPVEQP